MCAPAVLSAVRQELTRRGFVTAVAGVAAGALTGPVSAAAQAARPVRLQGGFRETFDLTHTFSPRLPVFPSFRPVQIRERFTIARDGFFANELTFDEHTGTHLDAPVHFVANTAT